MTKKIKKRFLFIKNLIIIIIIFNWQKGHYFLVCNILIAAFIFPWNFIVYVCCASYVRSTDRFDLLY